MAELDADAGPDGSTALASFTNGIWLQMSGSRAASDPLAPSGVLAPHFSGERREAVWLHSMEVHLLKIWFAVIPCLPMALPLAAGGRVHSEPILQLVFAPGKDLLASDEVVFPPVSRG